MAKNNGNKSSGAVVDRPNNGLVAIPPADTGIQPAQVEQSPIVKMSGGANMAEAGRGILLQQYYKLRKAEPVARDGTDPEGVHDMRVATRRLRAALKVLEETVYNPEQTARLRRQLRGLANALGETRDTDVFLEHLNHYAEQLPQEETVGLEVLREELLRRRVVSRQHMLKVLDNPKTEKLLRKLEKFVTTAGAGVVEPEVEEHEVGATLVRHFAGSAVWRRYEEVLSYETAIKPDTPIEVLHRLRVACKRLRYTLEFFQEALPVTVKTLHKQLIEVQDDLGAMHDHQVAIALSEELLRDHPEDSALRKYEDSRLADIQRLRDDFMTKWQTLAGSNYRKQLASALAGITA